MEFVELTLVGKTLLSIFVLALFVVSIVTLIMAIEEHERNVVDKLRKGGSK